MDSQAPTGPTADPFGAKPSSLIEVRDKGEIHGSVDLPFDYDPQYPGSDSRWGAFPQHEEIYIPAGVYDFEFEVSGGFTVVRKPTTPWNMTFRDGTVVGPGGDTQLRFSDQKFPAIRLQVRYTHAEWEGQPYAPLWKWQAEAFNPNPQSGKIVLVGPGRVKLSRYYNADQFASATSMLRYYDIIQNQKITFVARPRVTDHTVTASCTPNPVERGAEVECTARVSPDAEMTILKQSATGEGGFSIEQEPNQVIAAGGVHSWKGPGGGEYGRPL